MGAAFTSVAKQRERVHGLCLHMTPSTCVRSRRTRTTSANTRRLEPGIRRFPLDAYPTTSQQASGNFVLVYKYIQKLEKKNFFFFFLLPPCTPPSVPAPSLVSILQSCVRPSLSLLFITPVCPSSASPCSYVRLYRHSPTSTNATDATAVLAPSLFQRNPSTRPAHHVYGGSVTPLKVIPGHAHACIRAANGHSRWTTATTLTTSRPAIAPERK